MDINTVMQTPTPRASFALDLDRSGFAEGARVYAAVGVHHARNRARMGAPAGAVACDSSVRGTDVVSTAFAVITDRDGVDKGTRLGSSFWSPPV